MPRRAAPDTDAKVTEIIKTSIEDAVSSLEFDFAWSLSRCDSPIERLFAAALIDPRTTREYETHIELLNPPSGLIEHCQATPFPAVYMWQQIQIDQYRVDFLLEDTAGHDLPKLIVECDGHDFHEKTKEQAQRDKARDRHLVARGFRLLRFTGSEIYRDPYEAAHEALRILMGIHI